MALILCVEDDPFNLELLTYNLEACGYLGKSGYMKNESSTTTEITTSWKDKVIIVNWFDDGNHILKRHHHGYVYDIKTGTRIKVYRKDGVNHADLEPATYEDGLKMKKLGASWDARPAILYADGKFAACSINTMGHGDQTITDNGFEGQFCLHMIGSRTHESNNIREDHQEATKKAYKWAHG